MNKLFNAMTYSDALTENGAVTNSTSGSFLVDLFGRAGSSRGTNLVGEFLQAFKENPDLAIRLALYTRDPRGGYGERKHFRQWIGYILKKVDLETGKAIVSKIPEIGRFDDLIPVIELGGDIKAHAITVWLRAIAVEKNTLAAKWMPRKDRIFEEVRRHLGVPPKTLRKLLVETTNVVETQMCNREWDQIEYSKLPSRAQLLYRKAFARNDGERYEEYLSALEKGEAKVNSSVLYPYEIVANSSGQLREAQWKGLPDYVGEGSFLPMIDVSASMCVAAGNTKFTAMQVAMSLGIYLAERNKGVFKDQFLTFSERPSMQELCGDTLETRLRNLSRAHWGMNTDINRAMQTILDRAVANGLTDEDLPDALIVLSDMEFDRCGSSPVSEKTIRDFEASGFTAPKLVFWNIASRRDNVPVRAGQNGTVLVSGFSAAVMKTVLSGEVVTPLDMVKSALCVPKYDYL